MNICDFCGNDKNVEHCICGYDYCEDCALVEIVDNLRIKDVCPKCHYAPFGGKVVQEVKED